MDLAHSFSADIPWPFTRAYHYASATMNQLYRADFHGGGCRELDAARETTRERRCHDLIVSTLPAATHRIFMDRRLVGCLDSGRGAPRAAATSSRSNGSRWQFRCATKVGALQAQTVEAPGSDLLLDPVSRRLRQDDLASVPFEDNLHGEDVAYEQCRVRAVDRRRRNCGEPLRLGTQPNESARSLRDTQDDENRCTGIVRDRNIGSRHRCPTGYDHMRRDTPAGASRPSSSSTR